MIWLGIVIGIVVMQLVTLMIICISHEDEVVSMVFSVFLFYPFILLLRKIVISIKDRKRKKKQKAVQND